MENRKTDEYFWKLLENERGKNVDRDIPPDATFESAARSLFLDALRLEGERQLLSAQLALKDAEIEDMILRQMIARRRDNV